MRRILVIDNDPATIVGLSSLLGESRTVVVTCRFMEEAERALEQYIFDIVMVDADLSGIQGAGGTEVLSYIKERTPETRVIITTSTGSDEEAEEAYRLGAFLYCRKPVDILQLASVIRTPSEENLAAMKRGMKSIPDDALPLSPREREVLHWLRQGKSSWDMATILGISERTVNYHVNNIIRKLGVMNRAQAVFQAHIGS